MWINKLEYVNLNSNRFESERGREGERERTKMMKKMRINLVIINVFKDFRVNLVIPEKWVKS